jgi:hypothetical protein
MAWTIVFSRGETGDLALSDLNRVAIAAAVLAVILASTLLTTTSRGLAQAPGDCATAPASRMNVVRVGVNYRF